MAGDFMPVPTLTPAAERPLYRDAGDVVAIVQTLASPQGIAALLQAVRERRARIGGLAVPVPAKPIELEDTHS